eukprot:gene58143-biopygen101727
MVLDVLLVHDARTSVSLGVVTITTAYLMVFGAYGAHTTHAPFPQVRFFTGWSAAILVYVVPLVTDFHFTRGFAVSMREKHAALQASMRLAEDVGVCLAAYDVDEAAELVGAALDGALPQRLRDAMDQLVQNLRNYKPCSQSHRRHLAQSVLNRDAVQGHITAS